MGSWGFEPCNMDSSNLKTRLCSCFSHYGLHVLVAYHRGGALVVVEPPRPMACVGPLHTHLRVGLFVCVHVCLCACFLCIACTKLRTSLLWCGRYTRCCEMCIHYSKHVMQGARIDALMGLKVCHESFSESLHTLKVGNGSLQVFM